MEKHHFETITDLTRFMGLPDPENPMFYVVTMEFTGDEEQATHESLSLTNNFYTISLKKVLSGELLYGRTKYDCDNGSMIFMAPNQEATMQGITVAGKASLICMHDDFLKGHELRDRVRKYGYFSYTANEALHLSPKEEQIIQAIFDSLRLEYQNNQDQFSKELILSQLDTLLKYSDRFYQRQFLDRKELSNDLRTKFESILIELLQSGRLKLEGIPPIKDIAVKLGVSSRYLSDALKSQTGSTALQTIHTFLVEEAKSLLLEKNLTIEQTSTTLGFSYPENFSKLFKRKLGLSPREYREQFQN